MSFLCFLLSLGINNFTDYQNHWKSKTAITTTTKKALQQFNIPDSQDLIGCACKFSLCQAVPGSGKTPRDWRKKYKNLAFKRSNKTRDYW